MPAVASGILTTTGSAMVRRRLAQSPVVILRLFGVKKKLALFSGQ